MEGIRLIVGKGRTIPTINESFVCYWLFEKVWWIHLPGAGVGCLIKHEVTEHEDRTITVRPSILVKGHFGERHGFLERGIWRDC